MYDFIIDKLNSQISNNKISHAYLFEVNNYDDDFNVILNFVKMLFSNLNYNEVINSDITCFNQIDRNEYIDLFIIEPDGNDIKKNQIRNLLYEFNNKSLLDNKKIYIIKQCDKLNSFSANAILKFLEEPNDDIIGILVTNNRYKVIDTILSRCQVISFNDFKDFTVDSYYDDLINYIFYIKDNILDTDVILDNYFVDKNTAVQSIIYLQELIFNCINNEIDFDIVNDYNNDVLINIVLILETEKNKLNYNVNLRLWFDSLIVRILEVI